VAQVFPQDVNYRAANGNWEDIRSRVVPDPGYGWKATVRGVTVHFPTRLTSATPVRVDLPAVGSLSAAPQGIDVAAPAGEVSDGTLTYRDALPGMSQDPMLFTPKLVDAGARTTDFWKETVAPDGSIVSVKDKLIP
jgi:hypothetical protein